MIVAPLATSSIIGIAVYLFLVWVVINWLISNPKLESKDSI